MDAPVNMRVCERCGGPYRRRRGDNDKYCSMACYQAVRRAGIRAGTWVVRGKPRDPARRIQRECGLCGVSFEVFISAVKRGGGKYCSKECYRRRKPKAPTRRRRQRRKAYAPTRKRRLHCALCGEAFWAQARQGGASGNAYCGRACAGKAVGSRRGQPQERRRCLYCGNVFAAYHSRVASNKAHFCCRDCYMLSQRRAKSNKRYVFIQTPTGPRQEHRVVVETSIGRRLARHECVHHLNRNKHDNRIANLIVLTRAQHGAVHRNQVQLELFSQPA